MQNIFNVFAAGLRLLFFANFHSFAYPLNGNCINIFRLIRINYEFYEFAAQLLLFICDYGGETETVP